MTSITSARRGRARVTCTCTIGIILALGSSAFAQEGDGEPIDVEVPAIVMDGGLTGGDGGTTDDASDLDLANIVQSAAKGVTTVQEAPAIVTVITDDEIRDRQFQFLDQIADTVPGWSRAGLLHSSFPSALVRGQTQAVQYLHDGISLFDPGTNIAVLSRVQPVETIKRIEMITGPGGVLWGSNSLLGILNIITKDADDVDGIEVGGTVGHGNGDRQMARAYAMYGNPDLLGGKLKLFLHGSFETTRGSGHEMPLLLFHQPLPQPNAPNLYGPLTTASPPRSMIFNASGKLRFGKLQLRFQVPFTERHNPLGLSGNPVRENLAEDDRCGVPMPAPDCVDAGRRARGFRADLFDRYVVLELNTRFADQKAGISAKAYGIQFVRDFAPLAVLAPWPTIHGGLSFTGSLATYRAGGAIDGDIEIGRKVRVLYGGEGFTEWMPTGSTRSIQGAGTEATFPGPENLDLLPLLCPKTTNAAGEEEFLPNCPLTFLFPATRTVFGGYLNPSWRPSKKLILDAGARLQVAPGSLGSLSYKMQPTFGGSLVYEFIPDWHVKFNYTQGFRPPVFNNSKSNGQAVQITGNPDLAVETSDASQIEVNARIFKGERRIRELSFRADYSFTRLDNLIQVSSGSYKNSASREIHSAELLAKLYVQGGHRLELGYTWLRATTGDKGRMRNLPEHWFDLSAVFELIDDKLTATSNLRVSGAAEDANRLIEYRGLTYDENGELDLMTGTVLVDPAEVVMDRLPPIADLSLGLTYYPMPKLIVRATVFNALNGRFYQPDAFFDYEPHLEYLPNPFEDLRAYVSATYQY
jgi:outer membrane receptor protein involved in Fe transport